MSWPTLRPSPLAPMPTAPAPPSTSRHRLCQQVSSLPGCAVLRAQTLAHATQQSCWLHGPLLQHVPDLLFCLQLMVSQLLRHTMVPRRQRLTTMPRHLYRITVPQRLQPTAQSLRLTQAAWPGPSLPTHRHPSLALLACTPRPTPLWAPTAQLRGPCLSTVSVLPASLLGAGLHRGRQGGVPQGGSKAAVLEACPAPLSQGSQSGSGAPACSRDDCSSLAHCTTQPSSTNDPLSLLTHSALCRMAPP